MKYFSAIQDVIGVVRSAGDLTTVMGKQSNREIKKRDVQLVDKGGVQIRMTLWGGEVSLEELNLEAILLS